MKVSFVNQPWTIAAPPPGSDSTGIWSYQVGNYLAKYGDVIYYGSGNKLDSREFSKHSLGLARQIEYIEYQGISPKLVELGLNKVAIKQLKLCLDKSI